MVSDVLAEALIQIDEYLDAQPPIYRGKTAAMIWDLCEHMQEVLKELDTPPGTEREPVAQNETGK